jgi:hypothetical protein
MANPTLDGVSTRIDDIAILVKCACMGPCSTYSALIGYMWPLGPFECVYGLTEKCARKCPGWQVPIRHIDASAVVLHSRKCGKRAHYAWVPNQHLRRNVSFTYVRAGINMVH